jgi:hypothetical protein
MPGHVVDEVNRSRRIERDSTHPGWEHGACGAGIILMIDKLADSDVMAGRSEWGW